MGASGPAKTEQKLTYVRFPSLSFPPTSLFYFPLGGVPTDEEQATGLEREVMLAARKGQVRRMFHAFWESSLPWMGSEQPSLWGAFPPGNLAFGNSIGSP